MGKREGKEEDEALKIWDCGSPLYDSYELASFGHVIDRHIMALPSLGGSRRLITNQLSHDSTVIPSTQDEEASGKAIGCSMVGCFSEFLEKRMWKRRLDEEREERPKKVKTGFHGICNRIGSWKK